MEMDKGEAFFCIVVGVVITALILACGFLAGTKYSEMHKKSRIVAELNDGGFVVKDESGDLSTIYWEGNT